jgi:hypothetical protein
MPKHYLRKRDVARRYGVDERTVDRMKGRRIPAPKYLPGSRFPIWDAEALDQADRHATLAAGQVTDADTFARLLQSVAAASTTKKAREIVVAATLAGDLRAVSDVQLATLRDAIEEKGGAQ